MTARMAAYQALLHLEKRRIHPDELLRSILSRYAHLSSVDKAFATELVYGVLRWQGRLDWHIGRLSKVPLEKIDFSIKVILRLGLYQLLFLDRVPSYAAVSEMVKIARSTHSRHLSSFVNAILRRASERSSDEWDWPDVAKEPIKHLAVMTAHPEWLIEKLLKTMGYDEVEAFCRANNIVAPLVLRVNRIGREEVIQWLKENYPNTSEITPTRYAPYGVIVRGLRADISETEIYRAGFIQVQDEASQLVAYLVDPLPGERILDLCCGFGIKSAQLASIMNDRGEIVAVDVASWKLEALRENMARLGISIVRPVQGDVLELDPNRIGFFDRVLLDAPCTGWGTVRRNPDIKWRSHPRSPWRMSNLQKELLDRAARFVRPGGILVYSTCSVFFDENEQVAFNFQRNHNWKEISPQGLLEKVFVCKEEAATFVDRGFFKTMPHLHGMDGFFGAVWQKPK
ncbi:MAG: 16S rRNA (cytosine(967)-C(5))-methyltransferase RsmB [Syntrophobacterales bacterium]|nr:16S rRNA (cytosine(967)-C(5))-methyltransferase RsmB [Syntrophobacterales bacterium]